MAVSHVVAVPSSLSSSLAYGTQVAPNLVVNKISAAGGLFTVNQFGAFTAQQNVVTVSASGSVLPSNSLGTYLLASAAAAVTLSLPVGAALLAGTQYDFIVTGSLSNAVTIAAGSAIIFGNNVATDATAVSCLSGTAKSNVIFGTGSVKGDKLSIISDGTSWFGFASITTHTTLTSS